MRLPLEAQHGSVAQVVREPLRHTAARLRLVPEPEVGGPLDAALDVAARVQRGLVELAWLGLGSGSGLGLGLVLRLGLANRVRVGVS